MGGAEPPQFFFALKLLYLFTFHLKRFRAASFPASFGVVFVLLSRIYEQDSPPPPRLPIIEEVEGGAAPCAVRDFDNSDIIPSIITIIMIILINNCLYYL